MTVLEPRLTLWLPLCIVSLCIARLHRDLQSPTPEKQKLGAEIESVVAEVGKKVAEVTGELATLSKKFAALEEAVRGPGESRST
jgi:hypothetical protein